MGKSWVTNVRLPWRVTVPAGCPEPPEGGSRFQSSPALARTARRADEAQGPPQPHPPNMDRSSCYSLLLPSLSRTFVFRRISKTLRMFVFFLRKAEGYCQDQHELPTRGIVCRTFFWTDRCGSGYQFCHFLAR